MSHYGDYNDHSYNCGDSENDESDLSCFAHVVVLDCGFCGAPNCRSFADDVVRGYAKKEDCVVIMRRKMDKLKVCEINMKNTYKI